MSKTVDPKKLLEFGGHFGHQAKRWNPKMGSFIWGVQNGVHVFDLIKTKELLEAALSFLKEAAKGGLTIVFLGPKKQVRERVEKIAVATQTPYITERWLGGTLTNFEQIKKSIDKLIGMKKAKEAGEYEKFTKKERILLDREIARLTRYFGGISGLSKTPDVLFVVDCHAGAGALREAKRVGVKTVGIVDSNADPTLVDYPIPMNDDAKMAVEYVLDLVGEAIVEGKKKTKVAGSK